MNNTLKLIISITVPLATATTASFFTIPEINGWYQTIQKPIWNPPNYIFAPVWTTLYILMGIALFLVWKNDAETDSKRKGLWLFVIQLVLNFCWSLLFFNQHRIGLALIDILLLWLAILVTIFAFARVNKVSPWLLVPYISWVSFATILNFAIWRMNGEM